MISSLAWSFKIHLASTVLPVSSASTKGSSLPYASRCIRWRRGIYNFKLSFFITSFKASISFRLPSILSSLSIISRAIYSFRSMISFLRPAISLWHWHNGYFTMIWRLNLIKNIFEYERPRSPSPSRDAVDSEAFLTFERLALESAIEEGTRLQPWIQELANGLPGISSTCLLQIAW